MDKFLYIKECGKQIKIQGLIQKYEKVFKYIVKKLPPEIEIENIIEVKPSSAPMNVKTYRYPHHHKTGIEILIQYLSRCGVITRSISPYTSILMLVRKKDMSFILCIDYRGINKITIKYKFLIPFIDEMLDEIHGAE